MEYNKEFSISEIENLEIDIKHIAGVDFDYCLSVIKFLPSYAALLMKKQSLKNTNCSICNKNKYSVRLVKKDVLKKYCSKCYLLRPNLKQN